MCHLMHMVTLKQSCKCYECTIKYLRPGNGLVSDVETQAVTPAQNPEVNHAAEYFLKQREQGPAC